MAHYRTISFKITHFYEIVFITFIIRNTGVNIGFIHPKPNICNILYRVDTSFLTKT